MVVATGKEYLQTENWSALRGMKVGSRKPGVESLQGISQIHEVYSQNRGGCRVGN